MFLFPALLSGGGGGGGGGIGWQWGQCLASGGLIGDVFLHTLPHIMEGGSHRDKDHNRNDHEREEEKVFDAGSWILIGFFVFFTVDVLLRMTEDILHGTKLRRDRHRSHEGNHSHDTSEDATSNGFKAGTTKANTDTTKDHPSGTERDRKSWSLIILNLTADSMHNFTDGLAIGASYAAAARGGDKSSGGNNAMVSPGSIATLSILLHEVPHELGDYCTLVAAGYTPWQAVRAQFMTAIAAFCGTAVALIVAAEQSSSSSDDLLLVTAGGFLYLAGTTLLPHVLNESVTNPWYRLGHLVAFAIGLAFMQAVALLEDDEHHHDHDNYHQKHHETEL